MKVSSIHAVADGGTLHGRLLASLVLWLLGSFESSALAQRVNDNVQAPSRIQEWQIHPSLSVSEYFSDNVFLASKEFAQSEWTTRISPGIRITGNNARMRFSANYSPEYIHRATLNTSELFHSLGTTAYLELLPRTLYLDAMAGISQQNISLLAPVSDNNVNANDNRASVRRYSVSPYLHREFGPSAVGELRLTRDAVHPSSGAIAGSTSNRIDASVSNGPAFKLLTWNFALSRARIAYEISGQKVDPQSVTGTVGALVSPDIRLIANFGYEDSGYPTSNGQELKGTFWGVGPEWTPSPRTRISATLGHRYFGSSRAFHLEHRTRLSVWRLDYSEAATTARQSILLLNPSALGLLIDAQLQNDPKFQDPNVRQLEVQNRVAATPTANVSEPVNFLSDALFLEKRLQGTFGMEGVRNTLTTGLFTSNRTPLSSGAGLGADFIAQQTVRQTGANLSWTYRFSQTLSSILNLAASRNAFSSLNRTDQNTILRWGLFKQFTPKVIGSINLGRQQLNSNDATVGFRENSVSVTLAVRY